MDIRPIRTDEDHEAAIPRNRASLEFSDRLPEGDKLEVLTTLVVAYEEKRWPFPDPTPVETLRYACSDLGRSQKELAELIGSRSQASDLLKGRRRISLEMAQKISAAWSIPIELLVKPYHLTVAA